MQLVQVFVCYCCIVLVTETLAQVVACIMHYLCQAINFCVGKFIIRFGGVQELHWDQGREG